jgi:hypothetical protein
VTVSNAALVGYTKNQVFVVSLAPKHFFNAVVEGDVINFVDKFARLAIPDRAV